MFDQATLDNEGVWSMFKKTLSNIGTVAFAALLLAGAASTASAAVLAEKAFLY